MQPKQKYICWKDVFLSQVWKSVASLTLLPSSPSSHARRCKKSSLKVDVMTNYHAIIRKYFSILFFFSSSSAVLHIPKGKPVVALEDHTIEVLRGKIFLSCVCTASVIVASWWLQFSPRVRVIKATTKLSKQIMKWLQFNSIRVLYQRSFSAIYSTRVCKRTVSSMSSLFYTDHIKLGFCGLKYLPYLKKIKLKKKNLN